MSTDANTVRKALSDLADAATRYITRVFPAPASGGEFADAMRTVNDAYSTGLAALARLAAAEARAEALAAAIEEYRLWRPGEAGHAAAHRRLFAALAAVTPTEASR